MTPELTGYIESSVDRLIDATKRVGQLSRAACREEFEARFTGEIMVDRYEDAYRRVIGRMPAQSKKRDMGSPSRVNHLSSSAVFR
jgi:hypothetical protein